MKGGMSFYLLLLFPVLIVAFFAYMIYMPGESWRGDLPALDGPDRELAQILEAHVVALCGEQEGRNYLRRKNLEAARRYIADRLQDAGYDVQNQEYEIAGDSFANVVAEQKGTSKAGEIVVIGAHYDSVAGSPGADDNASGVAALLELARLSRSQVYPRTVRFVAFVNEEPPHFMTSEMGSYVYAGRAAENGENIVAMISLEMLGYYSDEPGSQQYVPPLNFFYPDRGNFIAFVGNLGSRSLVTKALTGFRKYASFPSEGIAAPAMLPGVSWSDHRSFWKHGYRAIMATDTAFYRNPHYHTARDRPETLDYEKMTYVVRGMQKVIEELLLE